MLLCGSRACALGSRSFVTFGFIPDVLLSGLPVVAANTVILGPDQLLCLYLGTPHPKQPSVYIWERQSFGDHSSQMWLS